VTLISYLALFFGGFSLSKVGLASSILIPALLVGVVGLIDDIKKLSPIPRFLVQNAIAIVSTLIMMSTQTIGSPTNNMFFDFFITIFWIVGLTNALNFFDNIDGGASGTAAISAFFLFVLALQGSQFSIAALSLVLAGGTLGFLIWNRPPARIYMGDAGALFLGLLIASLSVRFDPNPINQIASLSVLFCLVAIPILDTSVAVTSRVRRGISPFQGGKDHLSHRMIRAGFSKRSAVLTLWLLQTFMCFIALAISIAPYQYEGLISIFVFAIWIIMFVVSLSTEDE
jgi:UDP-GlcNAc:undecaprenyl-phosphate GlcNAc-1-phosphate transferase